MPVPMRVQIECENCQSSIFTVVMIDHERLSIKCHMCSWRYDIKPAPVKLEVS